MLNHGITTSDVDSGWMGLGAGEFIDRYVFPEGELPHLSLVTRDMPSSPAYLGSASIVRKLAETSLTWPVTTRAVTATSYPAGELAQPPTPERP